MLSIIRADCRLLSRLRAAAVGAMPLGPQKRSGRLSLTRETVSPSRNLLQQIIRPSDSGQESRSESLDVRMGDGHVALRASARESRMARKYSARRKAAAPRRAPSYVELT